MKRGKGLRSVVIVYDHRRLELTLETKKEISKDLSFDIWVSRKSTDSYIWRFNEMDKILKIGVVVYIHEWSDWKPIWLLILKFWHLFTQFR